MKSMTSKDGKVGDPFRRFPHISTNGALRRIGNKSAFAGSEESIRQGTVGPLKMFWKSFVYDTAGAVNANYFAAQAMFKDNAFRAKTIYKFTKHLASLDDLNEPSFPKKLGVFLSALINEGQDDLYAINLRSLAPENAPEYLGYGNEKRILVLGDVSTGVGIFQMGGIIRVKGKALSDVGPQMIGGILTIEGSAEDGIIGENMASAATIRVNGNIAGVVFQVIEDEAIPPKGKIYHKGNLVTQAIPPKDKYDF
jgi:hypothetical protein